MTIAAIGHRTVPLVRSATGTGHLRRITIGIDGIALMTGWIVFATGSRDWRPRTITAGLGLIAAAAFSTICCLVFAGFRGLYRERICNIKEQEQSRLVGVAIASGAIADLSLRSIDPHPDLAVLVMQSACIWALLLIGRTGYRSWLQDRRRRGFFVKPTIVIGANDEARHWCEVIADHPELGIEVRGVISNTPPNVYGINAPWLGSLSEGFTKLRVLEWTTVMVMVTALSSPELQVLTQELSLTDLDVQFSTGIMGIAQNRLTKTTLAHENLLHLEPRSTLERSPLLKRTLDVIVSAFILLITSPILLAAALAIRLEDGGPVFFQQSRVGRDGECFQLYKLRSMVQNAEALKADLADDNARTGPLFKMVGDPRVTRVGRILRATSIDELPQLLNVLRGEMSMVGPRPALPEEVEHFETKLLARQSVLPGITGLWQVEGRDAASFGSYEHLDLHYVENWSVLLDATIMIQTAVSLSGRTVRALIKRDIAS